MTSLFLFVSLVSAAGDAVPSHRAELVSAVTLAFQQVRDGWSADEVLVQEELNAAFLKRCRELLPHADPNECNWTLLNLRKAGKLDVTTTRRAAAKHEDYFHAAEIAARFMYDKYQLTIDRVLCDPDRRREFGQLAQSMATEVPLDRLRRAALSLRKARELKPELVARVADWGKLVISLPAKEIWQNPNLVPTHPGVYIFRDATGYLYVGESSSLRARLAKHLDQSDRESLARYLWKEGLDNITVELHAFDPDSQARSLVVRRAYESELIRSRKPRLNIAP